jgi:formyltetrahydrofolate synthetase
MPKIILAFAYRLLYDVNDSIESKIETIAKKIYGADGIDISPEAQVAIDRYKKQGTLIQNQ